jgi:hypothetical protein
MPRRIDTVNVPDRTLSLIGATRTVQIQRLYSLFLYDAWEQGVVNVEAVGRGVAIDPAGRSNEAEYYFSVPPKVHEMSEPFTTQIIATQNGGKYVESHGSIIKEIRVSGTTGLRPHKSSPIKVPLLGTTVPPILTEFDPAAGGARSDQSTPVEVTGHDDIMFLRNLFRLYSDLKNDEAHSRHIVMVWRNVKDDDYWVVEPSDFRLQQSSGSPLTYNYTISLKTLAKFVDVRSDDDTSPAEEASLGLAARVQEYSRTLSTAFLFVAAQATTLRGLGYSKIEAFLGPLTAVLRGISAIKDEYSDVVPGFVASMNALGDSVEDVLKTIKTDPGDELKRAFLRLKVTVARIRAEKAVQDVVRLQAARERVRAAYRVAGTADSPSSGPRAAGSTAYLPNLPHYASVAQATVYPEEGIRDIARRVLGDAKQWQLLVVTNYLVYPYVSATGGPGVLRPGDAILYPTNDSSGVSPSVINADKSSNAETSEEDTNVNSPIQQAYGRDLRLSSNAELTDLSVNAAGDISTIQGIPNVDQAVRIKFATEQGALVVHPRFGAKFPIGRKALPSSFNTFRINTLATLQSDFRIKSIESLQFVAVGDALLIDARLVLIDSQDKLSTNFALRRF